MGKPLIFGRHAATAFLLACKNVSREINDFTRNLSKTLLYANRKFPNKILPPFT